MLLQPISKVIVYHRYVFVKVQISFLRVNNKASGNSHTSGSFFTGSCILYTVQCSYIGICIK